MSRETTTAGGSAANSALIQRFYGAFSRRDVDAMLANYHPDVVFTDPVFGTLAGTQARAMWRMLNGRARDLRVVFGEVNADASAGSAHWEAWYTFTATGRRVHNRIDAEFEFADALIVRHVDRFSLWRWAAMALGAKGALLGWAPRFAGRFVRRRPKAWLRFARPPNSGAYGNDVGHTAARGPRCALAAPWPRFGRALANVPLSP